MFSAEQLKTVYFKGMNNKYHTYNILKEQYKKQINQLLLKKWINTGLII